MRTFRLLADSYPEAVARGDRLGQRPLHVLCKNPEVTMAALDEVLDLGAEVAMLRDTSGQLPLHHLCRNPSASSPLLDRLLEAAPDAHTVADNRGQLPLHVLVKTFPEASELWAVLLRRGGADLAQLSSEPTAASPSEGSHIRKSTHTRAMPVMMTQDGAVAGVVGKVKGVLRTGDVLEARPEDRGLLLFTSSMTAVKTTADACRAASQLMQALMVDFEERDVFITLDYANQLRRLHAAHLASLPVQPDAAPAAASTASDGRSRRAPLPQLPQLYANGRCVGGYDELRALDDEGQLGQLLEPYRRDATSAVRADVARDCDMCGGKRFVVCAVCNGSRRGRKVFDNYLKCAHCNENGLQSCPTCAQPELEKARASQVSE